MRRAEICVFDEQEEEFINLLANSGMNKAMAKILVCVALSKETSGRDIEIMTGIKSSTVSVMLKQLREQNLIIANKKNIDDGNRSVFYYSLAGTFEDTIVRLEQKKLSETSKYMDQIKKVKKYAS
ncbi:hypothetical protein CUJ83_11600 [Methanocella sp. CWC-04]|uniref:Uncharacterized protein n=1 Tax=Methanooceanicella nereidis TaxID=2052831 RepID=A0AAP2RED3_9EURY|nr:hypothetical protein [Methanocella sp. CWC-04]MCD1295642.1 hypothetical protein [Methanocella sp. CWC-04]